MTELGKRAAQAIIDYGNENAIIACPAELLNDKSKKHGT